MALIKNSNPKNISGSYNRILGDDELGYLISKIQSTAISSGTELEKIIKQMASELILSELDNFFENDDALKNENSTFLIPKESIKKSKYIDFPKHEPDFLILKRKDSERRCHIIELKDGHVFDTKKVYGEKEALEKFEIYIAKKIQYKTFIHICCFNKTNKKEIYDGMKRAFSKEEIITGEEFCKMLNINYQAIVNKRKEDAEKNFDYFLGELAKIDSIRKKFKTLI